jgi:coronin-1B/1C/6
MAWTNAASVAVWKTTDFRRFEVTLPLIKGHAGAITDLSFSPFHDHLLASASEDGKIQLWMIPEDGLTQHITQEDMALAGHSKKVMNIKWHNSVEGLLASSSIDNTVKVWDVNQGKCAYTFNFKSNSTSLQWNPKGNMLGTMIKGSIFSLFDPRANEDSLLSQPSHASTKSQKFQWIDDDTIVSCGFNQLNEREWAVWDLRQQGQGPLASGSLSDGTGIPHIYFDREHKLLYN